MMIIDKKTFFVIIFSLFCSVLFAQKDTLPKTDKPPILIPNKNQLLKKKIERIPLESALRAAVIPGWGQIYNRKYWKLPLVYGAIGGLGYAVYWNDAAYKSFSNSYDAILINNPTDVRVDRLRTLRNKYRRDTEFMVILTFFAYGLSILDATVDAHFSTFDVSDDISLKIEPYYYNQSNLGTAAGLTFKFDF
jgi:hypothetical protein